MKFSIIVPVYNVEKYLRKCLESIEKQTFKDFEVIIVNDGSEDNSQLIIDEFVKKDSLKFKFFIKENGGLSDARNFGIERALGEYLILLDSDDFIDEYYLENINQKIKEENDLDLIRVPKKVYNSKYEFLYEEKNEEGIMNGQQAFIYMRNKRMCIETAWSYCIKTSFWKKNTFSFPKGKLHEDFGVMLIVVLTANKIGFASNTYYGYLIRDNSIMTEKSYQKEIKKAKDKLYHYDYIIEKINEIEEINNTAQIICLEYISTALLEVLKKLKGKDLEEYKVELRKRNVLKNIKSTRLSIKILIKKIMYTLLMLK